MKRICLLVLGFFSLNQMLYADFGFSTSVGYSFAMPVKEMRSGFQNAHGFNFGFEYRFKESPAALGLELNIFNYGNEKEPYFIQSPFGSYVTRTRITANNMFNLSLLNTKFYLFNNKENVINPFLGGGIGVANFRTNLRITEPRNSPSHFSEVSEVLHRNNKFASKLNTGFSINLSRAFAPNKDLENRMKVLLNVDAGWIIGSGRSTYLSNINNDFLRKYNHTTFADMHYDTLNAPAGAYSLLVGEFEEFSSGDVSRHTIGNVYRNRLNMFNTNVGIAIRF